MSALNMTLDKKTGWWNVPMVWLVIALPLSAVVGGIITVVIAFTNPDGLVNEDVRKLGFTTTQGRDREDRAASLGLSASLRSTAGQVSVDLSGNLQPWPESVILRLVHPTRAGLDRLIALRPSGASGHYRASVTDIEPGRRLLTLEPADGAWRLVGAWPSSVNAEVRLGPGTQNSPTHLQR